jgi:hypothetical protein
MGRSGSGSFPKDSTGAEGPEQKGDCCSGSMKQGRHRYGERESQWKRREIFNRKGRKGRKEQSLQGGFVADLS